MNIVENLIAAGYTPYEFDDAVRDISLGRRGQPQRREKYRSVFCTPLRPRRRSPTRVERL